MIFGTLCSRLLLQSSCLSEANAALILHEEDGDSCNCCLPTEWGPWYSLFPMLPILKMHRACMVDEMVGIKMGRSSLLLSHRNTKITLVAWHLSHLFPSFSSYSLLFTIWTRNIYESRFNILKGMVKGEESGTCIEQGWQQGWVHAVIFTHRY